MSRALAARSLSGPSPRRRSEAGRTLLMKTSAVAHRRLRTSRPPAALMSITMLRLLRLACRYIGPMAGFRMGPAWRMMSPAGASTLITSAP